MEEILNVTKKEMEFSNKKLRTATNNIIKYTDGIRKNLLLIACELKRVKEEELYLDDGYTSVSDYANKVLGYSRANTSKLVKVAERFVEKGCKNTIFLNESGEDFTVGQLSEMLPLPKEEIIDMVEDGELKTCMTVKEIREQVKAHKEVDEEISQGNASSAKIDGEEVESEVVIETEQDEVSYLKKCVEKLLTKSNEYFDLTENEFSAEVATELRNILNFIENNL